MTSGPTTRQFDLLLNGQRLSVADVPVHSTLLDLLRAQGLTGAKEGCAEGECGACMVALVTKHGTGSAYQAVNSCLMLAPMAAGHEVYTVEALATGGELAPAQQAMASGGGSQCGYCTPGFVVSLFAEHYRPDRSGPCKKEALAGNLCRCTGYRPIAEAALSLLAPPAGRFLERLTAAEPILGDLHYATGSYTFKRPATLNECHSGGGDSPVRWIAGATDLAVESNLQFKRWPQLVSLEAIPELREFSEDAASVRIGAAMTLTELERRWSNPPEMVRQWFPLFASPAIRNRATLGGNLATASPVGDGAPMLLALEATVHLVGPNGKRTVPLSNFFLGYRRPALEPGELIAAIEIPKPLPAFTRFYKAAKRRTDDISTVAAGLSADFDENGMVTRAHFAFGGVAATPVRLYAAEEALLGRRFDEEGVALAQAAIAKTLKPLSDHRGSAEYRLEVAQAFIEKFCWEFGREGRAISE